MKAHLLLLLLAFALRPSSEDEDVCDNGIHQSPVNLTSTDSVEAKMRPLQWRGHWEDRAEGFDLINTGHTGGSLTDTYILEQVHFHWGQEHSGTEHAIEGERYCMEAHLVHYKKAYGSFDAAQNQFDGLAVIGILFSETTENNTSFDELVSGLRDVHEEGDTTQLAVNAMVWLQPHVAPNNYFTYQGSLTTPPCSEIVTWIVMKETGTIGVKQVSSLSARL
ncbi:hypothetical protein B566_EDAN010934 [Ephemera danica]|nr:hypothetical protein B566_EDAN010934 [Ephemera danica]